MIPPRLVPVKHFPRPVGCSIGIGTYRPSWATTTAGSLSTASRTSSIATANSGSESRSPLRRSAAMSCRMPPHIRLERRPRKAGLPGLLLPGVSEVRPRRTSCTAFCAWTSARTAPRRPDWRCAAAPPRSGPRAGLSGEECRRIEYVSSDDLVGYMQTGWPRCCGEVMTYFMETDGAGADDARAADASKFPHP
jgi:hypothetical protein